MIRLQDPMAFEAYVCLSPAEYISVHASGMATEIGLDSSCMQISERRHKDWFPSRRDTSRLRTSVACVTHTKHASICGQNYIKNKGSKIHGLSKRHAVYPLWWWYAWNVNVTIQTIISFGWSNWLNCKVKVYIFSSIVPDFLFFCFYFMTLHMLL